MDKVYGLWNGKEWLHSLEGLIYSEYKAILAARKAVECLPYYEIREIGEDGLPVELGTEQSELYFLCEGKTAADWREIALSNWKLYEMQRDAHEVAAGERNKAQQRITELEEELGWLEEQHSAKSTAYHGLQEEREQLKVDA